MLLVFHFLAGNFTFLLKLIVHCKGDGYGKTDSRLFKLLRYLNVATVIHK